MINHLHTALRIKLGKVDISYETFGLNSSKGNIILRLDFF